MRIFHYTWESFLWDDVMNNNLSSPDNVLNGPDCFGIYYVTGSHFVYGQETMLYIGKAQLQRFGYRLSQHDDFIVTNIPRISRIYVGKLLERDQANMENWGDVIHLTENLFINSHVPAMNAMSVKWLLDEETYGDILVCNWGDIGFILPEISGYRFSSKYWNQQNYSEKTLTE